MRKRITAISRFTLDLDATLVSELAKGNPELFRHQIADGPANVKKKAIGDVTAVGNAAGQSGKIQSQVVATVLFEFLAKCARPLGLLAAQIGPQFIAIDVQILEDVGVGGRHIGKNRRRGMLNVALDASTVQHIRLVTARRVAR